eukprot:CAMPEP_0170653120 /NCGR_PEP_ID=MMETSP0224-20130122/47244_1 /TAXON_ID=285029 /ORGANISM="Togula jolla, Strain CCCM 725" /LENGTH=103 /DNA_ID=CAMNT_0010984983 /DNA_START=26 /DNA_END=333 /DNA_ORIENTATION=-
MPAMTGVSVDDACVELYNELKMKKSLRFVTFKIENKKNVVPDQQGAADKTWADFAAVLPESEPRYGLVDVDYQSADGRPQSKLTFVFWSPDDGASVQNKMLYS